LQNETPSIAVTQQHQKGQNYTHKNKSLSVHIVEVYSVSKS